MKRVSVGQGAIVAAGMVLRRDLDPSAIFTGTLGMPDGRRTIL